MQFRPSSKNITLSTKFLSSPYSYHLYFYGVYGIMTEICKVYYHSFEAVIRMFFQDY